MGPSYTEILSENRTLWKTYSGTPYRIVVLTNTTVNLIKEILEYYLRTEGVGAEVHIGNYDNVVQDSYSVSDANLVVVFWDVCNLVDGLQARADSMSVEDLGALIARTEANIDIVLRNTANSPLVLFNKFAGDIFTYAQIGNPVLDTIAAKLNSYIEQNARPNTKLVDIRRVFFRIGIKDSADMRSFYSSRSLYTIDFYRNYVSHIRPVILAANGKSKKALIVDCDNTLWKGTVGEDGLNGIEMSSSTSIGAVFAEVQQIIRSLSKDGVLVGLCSRNNPEDIEEVFRSHPDIQLYEKDLATKKIGWTDKVSSLKEISQQLNIGLDSIVFIDDSPFEINMVREQLPEVLTLQVPTNVYDYPAMLREHLPVFFNLTRTPEDLRKAEMYQQQGARETYRQQLGSLHEYLTSLGQRITVFTNEESQVGRMAQLCQKTNQFNLTTKRYVEGEIRRFVADARKLVVSFSLADRFGNSGVTGLAILDIEDHSAVAEFDVFLMSCRVIGRNIEYAFMDYLISVLRQRRIQQASAKYLATPKNTMTESFYDSCGFSVVEASASQKTYSLALGKYRCSDFRYIEVVHGQ